MCFRQGRGVVKPAAGRSRSGPGSRLLRFDGPGAQLGETPGTVRRAIEFMEAHAGRDVGLAEIAAAARLGARGLQAAFRTNCDATPLEYLRCVRLARAHADLQEADSTQGDTVAGVATRWGFNNAGRFSATYRRAYGCFPGVTLRADPPVERTGGRGRPDDAARSVLDSRGRHEGDARARCVTMAHLRTRAVSRAEGHGGAVTAPNFDAALVALGIDPDDPVDAEDREAVAAVWSRRALGPVFDPRPSDQF